MSTLHNSHSFELGMLEAIVREAIIKLECSGRIEEAVRLLKQGLDEPRRKEAYERNCR